MSVSRRGFLLFGCAGVLAGCSMPGGIAPASALAHSMSPSHLTRAGIIAAINSARRAHGGCPPLIYSERLEVAARSQAELMVKKDKLSHDLGITLRQRVAAAGYNGAVGENLAGGQKTLDQAIDGWLQSSGHRATLLSTRFVEFGLAVAQVPAGHKSRYGTYWAFIAGGPFEAWQVT